MLAQIITFFSRIFSSTSTDAAHEKSTKSATAHQPVTSIHNAFELFLDHLRVEDSSASTLKNYSSDLSQFISFSDKQTLNELLEESEIRRFFAQQEAKGLKESSIQRKAASIKQFARWLATQGFIDAQFLSHPPFDDPGGPLTPSLSQKRKFFWFRGGKKNSPLFNPDSRLNRFSWFTALQVFALSLFCSFLVIFGYRQFFSQALTSLAYPTSPKTPARVLSFQGRLTDAASNPIVTATNLVFKLYDASSAGNQLWTSGTCSIDPDQDGIFSTLLGSSCGSAIDSSVFTENTSVWLEVTVGSETLSPRQQIATVGYALNSETIQGFPINSTESATTNTVVVMNEWGEILVGENSPKIRSVSGTFTIEGRAITLQTASGSNGNITFDADGLGGVISKDYLSAPGATISATYATGIPLVVNSGPSGTAEQLRLAYDSSNYLSFTVGSGGDVTVNPTGGNVLFADGDVINIGGASAAAYNFFAGATTGVSITDGDNDLYVEDELEVDGAVKFDNSSLTFSTFTSNGGLLYTNGSGVLAQTAVGSGGECLTSSGGGAPVWTSCSAASNNYWQLNNGALSPFSNTLDVLIGATATTSAKFAFINVNSGTPTASISAGTAGATYLTATGTLQTTAAQTLTLGGDTTGNIHLLPKNSAGRVGVNMTNPAGRLDVKSIGGADVVLAATAVDGSRLFDIVEDVSGNGFLSVKSANGTSQAEFYALSSSGFLTLKNGGSTTVHIAGATDSYFNGGNVAFGKDTASAKVDILGDFNTFGAATVSASYAGGKALVVRGAGSQTANLQEWQNSSGSPLAYIDASGHIVVAGNIGVSGDTDLLQLTANLLTVNGAITATGDVAVNGDDLTSDSNLTINATGYVRIGDTASPGIATGDDDLFVESDIELDGTLYGVDATLTGDIAVNGDDITSDGTLTITPTTTLTLNSTGDMTLDSSTDIILDADGADILFKDATTTFATFTNSSTDLTLDVAGSNFLLADGDVLNIGGAGAAAYNFFAGSTAGVSTPDGDNDLYIEDELEVDGTTRFGNLTYTWPSSETVNYILQTNGSGTLSWVDAAGAASGSIFWNQSNGALYPKNSTVDLLIGGQATTSAKFAVLNVNSGTPTASVSAGTAGAAYLTATGNLQSTDQQSLTLGGATTGDILIQPNSDTGDYFKFTSDATNLTLATTDGSNLTITPAGTLSLNSTGDMTLDSSTDIILDADGADVIFKDATVTFATFTNSSTDLTLDIVGGQLLLGDADVINIGGVSALAYNAFSDAGGATTHSLSSDDDLYIEGVLEVDAASFFDSNLTVAGDVAVNGDDITTDGTLTITPTTTLTLNSTGDMTLDSSGDIELDADGANIHFLDGGTTIVNFANVSTDLSVDVTGGHFIIANLDVINIGGSSGLAYNSITGSGTASFASNDNDLYIEDILEVGTSLYVGGNQISSDALWDNTLNVYHPLDEWAGVVDLAIGGTSTASAKMLISGTDGSLSSDGTTVIINDDIQIKGGDVLGNSGETRITIDDGTDKTLITGSLDVTSVLRSGSSFQFQVDASGNVTTSGDVAINGDDLTSDGNLTISATGYVRIADSATPGLATGDDDLFVESDIELDGSLFGVDATFTGDVAVNGDDITSDGTLTIDAVTDINLDADGADIFFKDAGTTFGTFTNSAGAITFSNTSGDLTIDSVADITLDAAGNNWVFLDSGSSVANWAHTGTLDLTVDVGGGNFILGNLDTINIGGGLTDVGYNSISDSTATSRGLASDDDLYIEGDFEVDEDGFFDGTLTIGNASADTVTVNSGSWTYANDTRITASGGHQALLYSIAGDTTPYYQAGYTLEYSSTNSFSESMNAVAERNESTISGTLSGVGQNFGLFADDNIAYSNPTLSNSNTQSFQSYGVRAINSWGGTMGSDGTDTANLYGVSVNIVGDMGTTGTTTKYGLYSSVVDTADTNYGIYTTVTGATANYAGAFMGGNVGIGTATPAEELHITGDGSTRIRINSATGNHGVLEFYENGSAVSGYLWYDTSNNVLTFGPGASLSGATVDSSGNVGIGADATNQFSVVDSGATQASGGGANVGGFHSDTMATNDISVLITTDDASASNEYFSVMQSERDGSVDNEFTFATNGTLTLDNATLASPADLAEMYKVNGTSQPGDLVSIETDMSQVSDAGKTLKITSGQRYDTQLIGIVSTHPGQVLGHTDADALYANPLTNPRKPIALAGRVPAKVTSENGPIKAGDKLTSSSIPGVAMKATQSGRIIGVAMEDYDGTRQISTGVQKVEDERLGTSPDLLPIPLPTAGVGKIMVFINPTWYNPELALSETGTLNVSYNSSTQTATVTNDGSVVTKISALAEAVIGKIRAGLITTQELVANLTIKSPELKTNLISPLSGNDVAVKLGKPTTSNPAEFQVKNDQDQTVASIDSEGNTSLFGKLITKDVEVNGDATVSGTIDATSARFQHIESELAKLNNLTVDTATVSGQLYLADGRTVEDILADNAQYIATQSAQPQEVTSDSYSDFLAQLTGANDASISALLAALQEEENISLTTEDVVLNTDAVFIHQYLGVSGLAQMNTLTVAGTLSVGDALLFSGNSISSTQETLELQPSGQGTIKLLAGLMTLDSNGHIQINGDLTVTGTLAAGQVETNTLQPDNFDNELRVKLATTSAVLGESTQSQLSFTNDQDATVAQITASGSARFKQLATQEVIVQNNSDEKNNTAGKKTLPASSTEIVIENNLITDNSLIYITPTTDTQNQVLFVKAKNICQPEAINCQNTFTVGINTAVVNPIEFNYWIVNVQQ